MNIGLRILALFPQMSYMRNVWRFLHWTSIRESFTATSLPDETFTYFCWMHDFRGQLFDMYLTGVENQKSLAIMERTTVFFWSIRRDSHIRYDVIARLMWYFHSLFSTHWYGIQSFVSVCCFNECVNSYLPQLSTSLCDVWAYISIKIR